MAKVSAKERTGNIPHGIIQKAVSVRTGQTMDRYVHVTDDSMLKAIHRFESVYAKTECENGVNEAETRKPLETKEL